MWCLHSVPPNAVVHTKVDAAGAASPLSMPSVGAPPPRLVGKLCLLL